jgi:hypothetical protein
MMGNVHPVGWVDGEADRFRTAREPGGRVGVLERDPSVGPGSAAGPNLAFLDDQSMWLDDDVEGLVWAPSRFELLRDRLGRAWRQVLQPALALGSGPSSQPRRRRSWLLKLAVASVAATAAVTIIPSSRPDTADQRLETGSGERSLDEVRSLAAAVSAPGAVGVVDPRTVTPTDRGRGLPPIPGPAGIDLSMAGAGLLALSFHSTTTTEPVGWVEPEIEAEIDWRDGGNGVLLPDVLLRIRFCESTNNYGAAHVASTARGAYQFLASSWEWYGHADRYGVTEAHLATPAQQDEAALLTLRQDGARPWAESRQCWDDENIDPRYLTAGPPRTTTTQPATTTTGPPATTTTTISTTTTTTITTTTSTTSTSSSSTTTA